MRRSRWYLSVLLPLAFAAACGDSSDPVGSTPGPPPPPIDVPATGPSFASMTIDGHSWQPETVFYFQNGAFLSIGLDRAIPGTMQVEGIGMFFSHFDGVGTYAIRAESDSTSYALYGVVDHGTSSATTYGSEDRYPGTVRITGWNSADSTVAGTFSFRLRRDLTNPTRVTRFHGSFRVRPSESVLPVEP